MKHHSPFPFSYAIFPTVLAMVLSVSPGLMAQSSGGDGVLDQSLGPPIIPTYQISGHVLDHNNNPVVGVGVYAKGADYQLAPVDTDTNGYYSFQVLPDVWTISLNCTNGTDSLSNLGYNCADSENVTVTSQNAVANFIVPNYGASELDGYLVDKQGVPLGGISVSASCPGYTTQSFTTDANGFFEFIVYNGNWNLSVSCTDLNAFGYGCVSDRSGIQVGSNNVTVTNFVAQANLPAFFAGAASLGDHWFYLAPATNSIFGYYSLYSYPYIYHLDMGFEYVFDAKNSQNGIYLYDFTDNVFLYTAPAFFPYLYDFSLGVWVYYCPDSKNPGHYTSNPRWFYDFDHKKWTTHLNVP